MAGGWVRWWARLRGWAPLTPAPPAVATAPLPPPLSPPAGGQARPLCRLPRIFLKSPVTMSWAGCDGAVGAPPWHRSFSCRCGGRGGLSAALLPTSLLSYCLPEAPSVPHHKEAFSHRILCSQLLRGAPLVVTVEREVVQSPIPAQPQSCVVMEHWEQHCLQHVA